MNYSTDPTYLRTIVDGLSSGALQKDNPSSLPQGLVGVYEEAIPPASQVSERKKFLEFFGVWALLQKEVSAEFVVSLLDGWSEEQVLAFIGRYSKWFNSPVSGVYTLYHERFRTFVLQKISGSQLRDINNRLIMACNDALTRRLNDEWERYALEYLSAHLLQPSLDNKERGSELKALAYSTKHWNRQIEVSKRFDWSKRLLNDIMLWASKYDDDQVIECALNKVDLHHMEQNDAPRIVELVAQNDIETALQRIESFGGNDKEGLQRKFILYMLCLMELTLLESKAQPWRKSAIEKLLKHLDEGKYRQSTCWSFYFPPEVMFDMAQEWMTLGVDYTKVYSIRTQWDWEVTVFQSACQSENANLIKELFHIIYAGTRENDRDWVYGCAAANFGVNWVIKALQSDFFHDSVLIKYFVANGLMVELESHLNGISDNERLLSACLLVSELLLLKGDGNIDHYLFETGELLDYYLDSDEALYYNSLDELLFRYILVLIIAEDSFSKSMAYEYFELYLEQGESREYSTNRSKLYFLLSTVVIMVKLGINQERIEAQIRRIPKNSETRNSATTLLMYYSDWYNESKSNNNLSDGSLDRMDFSDMIQLLASVVHMRHHEDLVMERYSCSLSNTRPEPRALQIDLLQALEYKGISGDEEFPILSSIGNEFEALCKAKYSVKSSVDGDESQALIVWDVVSEIPEERENFEGFRELYAEEASCIDWEMQWNVLKSIRSSEARVVFLESLNKKCNNNDLLGFAHIHMRYYKSTKGPLLRKHLFGRLLDIISSRALIELFALDRSKWRAFLELIAFLFKENAVVNKDSFSDYEMAFFQLRDISADAIEMNVIENRNVSLDLIGILRSALLHIFDEGEYSNQITFLPVDLSVLCQGCKKFLSALIVKLAESYDYYNFSLIEDLEDSDVYRYYYAAALVELKNDRMSYFERNLELSYNQIDETMRFTLNRELARDLNSFIYAMFQNSTDEEIVRRFNFPFMDSDIRNLFRGLIIKHTGFSIKFDILLNYSKWQEISPGDLEQSLLFYYTGRLMHERDEDILSECGNTLNIQWALDIKNSFSAN